MPIIVANRFHGRLDILVNVAGIPLTGSTADILVEEFRSILDTNMIGTFFICRTCLLHSVITKGDIINRASTAALHEENYFFIAQIWGNLISYLILKPMEIKTDETRTNSIRKYDKCGANFSEQEYKRAKVINQIDPKTVNILCIVYICICICSILIIISFLNQRRKASKDNISLMFRHSITLLISTIKHLRHAKQLFLSAQFTL
ncbi:unnamed protein product, partial [Rotaria sordida]